MTITDQQRDVTYSYDPESGCLLDSGGRPLPYAWTEGDPTATAEDAVDLADVVLWTSNARADDERSSTSLFGVVNDLTVAVVGLPDQARKDDFESQAPLGRGPDVLLGNSLWLEDFVGQGLIAVPSFTTSQYPAEALDAFTVDGQVYCVPIETNDLRECVMISNYSDNQLWANEYAVNWLARD